MRYMLALILVATCVAGLTYEDAKDALLNATLDVEQAKREGFPYESLSDALALMNQSLTGSDPQKLRATALALNESDEARPLAQRYFAMLEQAEETGMRPGQNFTFVIETAHWIAGRKQLAFNSREHLVAMENEIAAVDEPLNLSAVDFLIGAARSAYESEHFERVFELVNESRVALDSAKVDAARERALVALAKRTLVGYVRENWIKSLFIAAFLAVLGVWAFLELRVVYALVKMKLLRRDIDVAQEMLLNAQKEYYGGTIGRLNYKNRLDQQRETMRSAKGELNGWGMLRDEYMQKSLVMRFKR